MADVLTPSVMLPPTPTPDAVREQRITTSIKRASDEARMCASADFVNGSRPASRAEAELLVVRNQRDQLIRQVEDLRAELAPLVLAQRFFGALLVQTCGGIAQLSDEDLDSYATAEKGVEFRRNRMYDGWIAETSTVDATTGRQA